MTTTDTYDALLSSICEAATNEEAWQGMLILADYLEEQGDARARGWRRVAAERRTTNRFPGWESGEWTWFRERRRDVLNCIPPKVFDRLRGVDAGSHGIPKVFCYWKCYRTLAAALEDLACVYSEDEG